MGKPTTLRSFSIYWLPVVVWMATIFTLSSFSTLPSPPGPFNITDKMQHSTAYAILGALALRAFRGTQSGWTGAAASAAAVALAAFYGVTDEFHQCFVLGRSCDVVDWVADVSGALIIVGLAAVINYFLRRRDQVGRR